MWAVMASAMSRTFTTPSELWEELWIPKELNFNSFHACSFYKVQNWFTFTLLALLPAIFLLIGNTAIIIAFRKWTKQSRLCQASTGDTRTTAKRYQVLG